MSGSNPRRRWRHRPIRATQNGYIGIGARCYLTRRLFLRGEYLSYEVFTNNNSNEVKKEWKVGLAFFY